MSETPAARTAQRRYDDRKGKMVNHVARPLRVLVVLVLALLLIGSLTRPVSAEADATPAATEETVGEPAPTPTSTANEAGEEPPSEDSGGESSTEETTVDGGSSSGADSFEPGTAEATSGETPETTPTEDIIEQPVATEELPASPVAGATTAEPTATSEEAVTAQAIGSITINKTAAELASRSAPRASPSTRPTRTVPSAPSSLVPARIRTATVVPNLAEGNYIVAETEPPSGYLAVANIPVTIGGGQPLDQVLNLVDPVSGGNATFTVNKFNSANSSPLTRVCFTLFQNANGQRGAAITGFCDFVDDPQGFVLSRLRTPGNYILAETLTPAGFTPSADILFTLDPLENDRSTSSTHR